MRIDSASGRVAASATDVAGFLECAHLTSLDLAAAAGRLSRPFRRDPAADLLAARGLEHEQAYLATLRLGVPDVVQIPDGELEDRVASTLAALRGGAPAVYQAALADDAWSGLPDFLVRVDQPSALGPWSYEVVDAKLAREAKARALIQLCVYCELLARAQGSMPAAMHLVLGGDRGRESFRVATYLPYFRFVRRSFSDALRAADGTTYPEPVEHCAVCNWFASCEERWRADDHLSLVAGITRQQTRALEVRGVTTVAALGALRLPMTPPLERVGAAALGRIRDQAALQVRGRDPKRVLHELLPVEAERGLAALPPPSPGDVFLDFEGDPYTLGDGIEYLLGMVQTDGGETRYEGLWARDRHQERAAFERLVDHLTARRARIPDLHVYHYNHYEPTALKRLAGRYGSRVEELDTLLRGGVFVDLYRVVRQALRASVESYSIKELEPLYGFERAADLRDASRCLQAFVSLLELGGDTAAEAPVRETIEAYNRDDCLSAARLRDWLETERQRLAASGATIPRPAARDDAPSDDASARQARLAALVARLTSDVPEDDGARSPEQRGRWLLAQMLDWHWREEKSTWWEYFRLCELSERELLEDGTALAGLEYVGVVRQEKQSLVHRYRFPPQEHAIDRAPNVHDPRTGDSPGSVEALDDLAGTIDLKRGKRSNVPHPGALIPYEYVQTREQRESLWRLATAVAGRGIAGPGPHRAARDLLLRVPPRLLGGATLPSGGESVVEAAQRLVLALDDTVLPIQGPPGTGKTFTGARMIVALVAAGKRVGITANSHKVICGLLVEVCRAARKAGVSLRAIQKVKNDDEACDDPCVEPTKDNADVVGALHGRTHQVAAGTAWLWAREDMANAVEVLFVDEAGQMALANTLAIAQAARSLVLLGDPQQLEQPQKGVHPPGADVSALAHLVGGATMQPGQGLFLDETWRLHHDVCRFVSETFYEDRLAPHPDNARQRLHAPGVLDGTGLRFVPVAHRGNQNESPEEVLLVRDLIAGVLGTASWTDRDGVCAALTPDDILVVAPYNAHVAALRSRVPAGVRVGTVDKFQGQQAPVVIYSMATSTPEEAPRGMEFLYSRNRLNVAISRARCVAVLVASPALFAVRCRTPRQMELASAFCRFLELIQVSGPSTSSASTP